MVRFMFGLLILPGVAVASDEPGQQSTPISDSEINLLIEKMTSGETRSEVSWNQIFRQRAQSRVADFCFSRDGEHLASCTVEGHVTVWNLSNGESAGAFKVNGKGFRLALAPNGRHVVVGADFASAQVWDVRTGKQVFNHDAFRGAVTFLTVSADGRYMMGADATGFFHKFPLMGGRGFSVDLDPRSEEAAVALAVSADSERILYTLATGETTLLRLNIGTMLKPRPGKPVRLGGKLDGGTLAAFGVRAFASAAKTTVTVAVPLEEGRVSIGSREFRLTKLSQIAISPDDKLLAGVTSHGHIEIFDLQQPSVAIQLAPPVNNGIVTGSGTTRIATDCQSVAVFHERHLMVWKISNTSLDSQRRVQEMVRQMLDAGQYSELSRVIRTVSRTDEVLFSELLNYLWPSGDSPVYDQRLRDIVAWHEAEPKELMPRLMMARREQGLAWQIRGSGFADSVSDRQWKGYYQHIDDALNFLKGFRPDESTPGLYYLERVSLHTARGSGPDEFRTTVDLLMRHRPNYLPAHNSVVRHLMPRWHGEPGDSAAYAARVADRIGGDKGESMYVAMAESLLPYHHTENYIEITRFDYDRIRKWLTSQQKAAKSPAKKDEVLGLLMCFARRAGDVETAQKHLAEVMVGGWLARNRNQPKRYSDVTRTVLWLKSKGRGVTSEGLKAILPPLPK